MKASFIEPMLLLKTDKLPDSANLLWFDAVQPLQQFVFQEHISHFIGADLSVGAEYRPFLNNNVILTMGIATLIPGAFPAAPIRYEALPRFPAVERDLAFVLGSDRPPTAAQVESVIRETAGSLLRRVVLFDVFRFPDGRSSLAWRLLFQADDRTLTDDEVNAIQERIVRRITETFHLTLRSG